MVFRHQVRWPSGLRRTPGERVPAFCGTGVRIPPSPDLQTNTSKVKKFTLTHYYSFFSPNKEVAYILFKPSEFIDFAEGQFLLLEKDIDSKPIKRAYSIATTRSQLQKEGVIGTIVKRVSENGMSNYLVKKIQPKDNLKAIGPLGHMKLDENAQNLLLIAIGSGLSPIFSIYQALIEKNNFQKIAFLY